MREGSTTVRAWPLIGRDALVASVLGAFADACVVVLRGDAGLGKSRISSEVASALSRDGVRTHRIVASPATQPIPLAPFSQLIGTHSGAAAVGAVLTELGADGATPGPGAPMLIVDDLHLLDDASATVVHQLSLTGAVRVLGTVRSAMALPAAIDRLRHELGVVQVDVPLLDDAAVVEMVEAALGGPLDARSRSLLQGLAAGNPLYARELVHGSLAAGVLTSHAGVWILDGQASSTPLLTEVVAARLAPLGGDELHAMELLAVGGALELDLLTEVIGTASIESLERAGLVTSRAAAASLVIDVAHPLHREQLRGRLGPIALLRIHRALAAAAGAPDRDRPTAHNLRAALWHVRGGLDLPPDLLVAVARQALRAGDPVVAAELALPAFHRHRHTGAAFLASWCRAQIGEHDEGIEIMRAALAWIADPWECAAARLRIAEELWWTGRCTAALDELESAVDATDPAHALLVAQQGLFAALGGDTTEARRLGEPLLDHGHLWVRYVATLAVANASVTDDEPDQAIELCGRVVADAGTASVDLIGDTSVHLAMQLTALAHRGDLAAAAEFAVAARRHAAALPSLQARAWAAMLVARTSTFTGAITDAAQAAAEAERLFATCGLTGLAAWCAAGLARAQQELGATDEAAGTEARLDAYDLRGFGLYEPWIAVARAWVAHGAGDRAGAARAIDDAIELARSRGQRTFEAWAWHDAARLDLLGVVVADVASWARPTQPASALRWDLVDACRRTDRDVTRALTDVAERFEAIGALLHAAEAFTLAAGAAKRTGDAKAATALDGRAGALLARCAGASTPLLAGRHSEGPLSAREREISSLAAGGLSNRQIAERLVVSERTVENHLYRAFIKLGITSRDQLR
jgi:DNA-binding CsgD family transcriptional regulator